MAARTKLGQSLEEIDGLLARVESGIRRVGRAGQEVTGATFQPSGTVLGPTGSPVTRGSGANTGRIGQGGGGQGSSRVIGIEGAKSEREEIMAALRWKFRTHNPPPPEFFTREKLEEILAEYRAWLEQSIRGGNSTPGVRRSGAAPRDFSQLSGTHNLDNRNVGQLDRITGASVTSGDRLVAGAVDKVTKAVDKLSDKVAGVTSLGVRSSGG
jgi:hypothetical protein